MEGGGANSKDRWRKGKTRAARPASGVGALVASGLGVRRAPSSSSSPFPRAYADNKSRYCDVGNV
eukprot:scaffold40214_cov26-Tisochrysis_lutea.AAC.6